MFKADVLSSKIFIWTFLFLSGNYERRPRRVLKPPPVVFFETAVRF
jgi:hypothetical protein